MAGKIQVVIEASPEGVSVASNLKHPVDVARVLADALRVTLAPQEQQSRIVKPNPPGLELVG